MQKIVHLLAGKSSSKKKPGLEKLVHALADAQEKLGLDVSVWKIGDQLGEHERRNTKTFPQRTNRFRLTKTLRSDISKLPSSTIFHVHGGFVPEYFALARRLKRASLTHKVVVSSHGSYSETSLRNLSLIQKTYFYFFEHSLIQNAAMIHLVGPAEVSGYNFYLQKITPHVSLPNGLSDAELPSRHARDYLSNENFVVMYNGNLDVYEKGLDILLEAYAEFSRQVYSPTTLYLLGEGRHENKLKNIAASLGIENKIKFLGNPVAHIRRKLLQEAHVFVQPSRLDCIPTTALEAASEGVPLIVSEETNLAGFVRQNEAGWFLSRNDVKSLTAALHDAYFMYQTDVDAYLRRSENAYRMVREELNWNALALKWIAVYHSVL
jgi:glycosyltransferase involved in cell wall biosynthesis